MGGIVLFDGVCNFCDASVQFIMKHDQKQYYRFASIQSEAGQRLIAQYNLQQLDSVIVIDQNKAYIESDAPIQIVKHFNGLYPLLRAAKMIPKPIRNKVYRYIAKNRYKWFGQKETCRIPTKEERALFLE